VRTLSLPWDTKDDTAPQEFKVLTQIGAFIKQGGVPHVTVRKLIMEGQSGSAGQVRRYIAQEGHIAVLNGRSVFDGYFPAETAVSMSSSPIEDQSVPVVEIQGETELLRSFEKRGFRAAYRRADGPLYRLYEVPGMSHISTLPTSLEFDHTWNCGVITVSDFPQEAIYMTALDLLVNWVDGGVAPPHLPRIETSSDGSVIERDAFGNAKGGWRTAYLDVPFATYDVASSLGPQGAHGPRCDMIGNIKRLDETTLKQLYPTHADYVRKFNADIDGMIANHWYLPEEAAFAREEARMASIP
jgi:hypothetical protein